MEENNYKKLSNLLYYSDPYEEIPQNYLDNLRVDLQGWIGMPWILEKYVEEKKPSLIIEVGSWKGLSASIFAKKIQELSLDCAVLCVDTWLGSVEHQNSEEIIEYMNAGFPEGLYYQFLFNMKQMNYDKIVLPFRQTGHNAAKFLLKNKILADMIFIDASHEEEDVTNDLIDYYRLLRDDGIIIGDDFEWDSVRYAAEIFASDNRLNLIDEKEFYIMENE